jgi:hypothetical protein
LAETRTRGGARMNIGLSKRKARNLRRINIAHGKDIGGEGATLDYFKIM